MKFPTIHSPLCLSASSMKEKKFFIFCLVVVVVVVTVLISFILDLEFPTSDGDGILNYEVIHVNLIHDDEKSSVRFH